MQSLCGKNGLMIKHLHLAEADSAYDNLTDKSRI